jgi:hypothetical protein
MQGGNSMSILAGAVGGFVFGTVGHFIIKIWQKIKFWKLEE